MNPAGDHRIRQATCSRCSIPIAEHAARICEAQIVDIFLVESDMLRDAASFGDLGRPPAMRLDRSTVTGRSICDLQPVHIADLHSASEDSPRAGIGDQVRPSQHPRRALDPRGPRTRHYPRPPSEVRPFSKSTSRF